MRNNLRRIPFEKAFNFRDLGGYPTQDGLSTAWGKLYRSDALNQLTDNDLNLFEELQIKTVIDLRSKTEATALKDIIPINTSYYHCPIQDIEINPDGSAITTFENTLAESYMMFLTKTGNLFCSALNILCEGLEKGAVVFHCSAGKDRTGAMAATVLKLLGVSYEDIIADYQVSGTYNEKGINSAYSGTELNPMAALRIDSSPANLEILLNFFRQTDLEQHLLDNGLKPEKIYNLKRIMLK